MTAQAKGAQANVTASAVGATSPTDAPSFQSKSEVRDYVRSRFPTALPLAGLYKNLSQILDHQKGNWAAFKALSDEPPMEGVLHPGLQWYFPRLNNEQSLEFVKPAGWTRSLHGFQEPSSGPVIPIEKLDGFLVPGVAFSKTGQRIGRGKGFYDRTLKGSAALKVGVCYSFQMFNELPVEEHDIQMDVVVTDQEIIWLKR